MTYQILPNRHPDLGFGDKLAAAKEKRGFHAFELQALLAAMPQRSVDVRGFHKAEAQTDPFEPIAETFDDGAFVLGHARHITSLDGQDDNMLVQDMVVFEVVQERRWRG